MISVDVYHGKFTRKYKFAILANSLMLKQDMQFSYLSLTGREATGKFKKDLLSSCLFSSKKSSELSSFWVLSAPSKTL